MRVDHREVSIQVVDGVPDEGARFHAGHLSGAHRVEDDEPFHEPLVWHPKHRFAERPYRFPKGACPTAVSNYPGADIDCKANFYVTLSELP